jgi:translation initiation factor 3 subunit E
VREAAEIERLATMEESKQNYDLTPLIAPNLDRHLVFPIFEFLQERQLYPDEQILKSKIQLLNQTNMVDYAMDIHKSLYHTEDAPQGILVYSSLDMSVNLRFCVLVCLFDDEC